MSFTLEICCYNYHSAIIAAAAGAHRIELCADAAEGGTTPGYGTIRLVKENAGIDVYPIIRPRGGDFFYSAEEFAIMKADIQMCKDLGCEGVVIGMLQQDGNIDAEHIKQLVALAYPMGVTFHRAFDRAINPFEALETIISTGCERILTSGQQPSAPAGAVLLNELVRQANERIVIMPGAGVRAANIVNLAKQTGAAEFHSSASTRLNSPMQYFNDAMQENLQTIMANEEEIKRMRANLLTYFTGIEDAS